MRTPPPAEIREQLDVPDNEIPGEEFMHENDPLSRAESPEALPDNDDLPEPGPRVRNFGMFTRQPPIVIPGIENLTRALADLNDRNRREHPENLSINEMTGLIPSYDGKSAPDRFLNGAELVYNTISRDQIQFFLGLLRIKLSGRAYDACSRENFASWQLCKRAIRQACQSRQSSVEIKATLVSIRQGSESVREYGERLERVLADLNGTIRNEFHDPTPEVSRALALANERYVLTAFEDGLKEEELRVMMRVAGRSTLSDAISLASQHEARIKRSRPERPRQIFRDSTYSAPGSDIKCFKCNQSGHIAPNCHKNSSVQANRNSRPTGVVCFKCNQPGHIAPNCTVTNDPRGNRNFVPRPPYNSSNPNPPNSNRPNPNPAPDYYNDPNFCRYCKQSGHNIRNCHLRVNNNARWNTDNSQPLSPQINGQVQQRTGYTVHSNFQADQSNSVSENYTARDVPMGQAPRAQ